MQTKDFKSVKEARAAAIHQLEFYNTMMAQKKANESVSAQYIREEVEKEMQPLYDTFEKSPNKKKLFFPRTPTQKEDTMTKKLFIVETISTFKHTYVVEAEELEHAYDEVTMIDSGADEDYFESVEQVSLGETIIGGREISMKKFRKLLKKVEEDGTGSPWMGEQLIRSIDYGDEPAVFDDRIGG